MPETSQTAAGLLIRRGSPSACTSEVSSEWVSPRFGSSCRCRRTCSKGDVFPSSARESARLRHRYPRLAPASFAGIAIACGDCNENSKRLPTVADWIQVTATSIATFATLPQDYLRRNYGAAQCCARLLLGDRSKISGARFVNSSPSPSFARRTAYRRLPLYNSDHPVRSRVKNAHWTRQSSQAL